MLDSSVVIGWSKRFDELMDQLRPRFSRSDLFARARDYVCGLLSQVQRKNSWQLAESTGAATPHGFQRLLGRARWNADSVRDDLRHYVIKHLGTPQAILVVDETGFLKKGNKSAGVSRQYSGTAGRIENCQIGVFLGYRSCRGHTLIDRELYLPKSWTDNSARCREAGIPAEVGFATKPELARRLLRRAFEANVPASWVTADEVYGGDSKFRRMLEKQGIGYVVAIPCKHRLFLNGVDARVDEHADRVPKHAWKKISCGAGTKGQRFYQWTFSAFPVATEKGLSKGLLVRRSINPPHERAYFITCAPENTTLKQLVQVAGSRWSIEECFEQAKQETGLDEYEVRSWTGWRRHITLSMFAQAFLAATRSASNSSTKKKKNDVH